MISIRILWFLLVLCSLSTVSTSNIRRLNSIRELANNNIGFGKAFPRHGLKLLYWLSHNLEIDQNNVMLLVVAEQRVNIIPSDRVYGFHLYGNHEGFLPSDPSVRYFTLGNLNPTIYPGSQNLPDYVTEDYNNNNNRHDQNRNRDRIIVQLDIRTYGVNRLYISEHYDERHTYEISRQLLREIQNIPDLDDFLRQAGYDFSRREAFNHQQLFCTTRYPRSRHYRSIPECDTSESLRLEVRPGDKTNARITWSGIPDTIRKKNLFLRLFSNMDSSKPLYSSYSVGEQESGSIDTNVPLDSRLQVRLMECKKCFLTCRGLTNFRCLSEAYIWWGQEFDEANNKLPAEVLGYNARLQLFVKNGKACARLYINSDFSDWMQTFYYSWVGFYERSDAGHSSYKNWQWATKFNLQKHPEEEHTSLTYEYESGLDIQHGFQVRFFLQKPVQSILAHTVPWGEETVREMKNNVQGYDASLQLFADGGEALARIYIKRDFTYWKDTFANSWVGFYERSSDQSTSYMTWQWVTRFEENDNMFTEEYMAYDYKSNMIASPQAEARFFLTNDYTSQKGRALLNKNMQLTGK